MTGKEVTEVRRWGAGDRVAGDRGRNRNRSAADPVGRWKAGVREGVREEAMGSCCSALRSWVRRAAQHQGTARPRTVDSRTWLWKCCSRADTSSCPSILLHARRRVARIRALRRTIARGRRGYTVSRGRTGTPPRTAAGWENAASAQGEAAQDTGGGEWPQPGRGLRSGWDSCVTLSAPLRQRRAPLRLGLWAHGR